MSDLLPNREAVHSTTTPLLQARLFLQKATWFKFSLISLLYLAQVWLFRAFWVDDPFITFRYIRQWTHGNGLVYNIGERVEGYSNFLWVVVLAPFDVLGIDLVLASKIVGIILGWLTLAVTYRFARRLEWPEIAPLLLAATAPFAAWAAGGLETMLFALLLVWGSHQFLQEEETRRGWLSGILFGLLALTRPEGLGFAGLAVVYRLWHLYRSQTRPASRDFWRWGALGLIVIPYFIWRLSYYGYLLPNTVYAKAMGLHPRALLEGGFYLYQNFITLGGIFFVALPLALAFLRPNRPGWYDYLALNLAFYVFFVFVGGGDWMPMQRFLVHVLPLVYLLIHAGLEELPRLWSSKWASIGLAALLMGQVGYLLLAGLDQRFIQSVIYHQFIPQPGAGIAYIRDHTTPEDTIALVDAGMAAYLVPLETRVIDMVGLADSHIAHRPPQFPGGLLGRGDGFGKWDVDYVLAQQPKYVQLHLRGQDQAGHRQTDFTGTTLLINDPRFQTAYQLISEEELGGLFVRKD